MDTFVSQRERERVMVLEQSISTRPPLSIHCVNCRRSIIWVIKRTNTRQIRRVMVLIHDTSSPLSMYELS